MHRLTTCLVIFPRRFAPHIFSPSFFSQDIFPPICRLMRRKRGSNHPPPTLSKRLPADRLIPLRVALTHHTPHCIGRQGGRASRPATPSRLGRRGATTLTCSPRISVLRCSDFFPSFSALSRRLGSFFVCGKMVASSPTLPLSICISSLNEFSQDFRKVLISITQVHIMLNPSFVGINFLY